MRTILCLFSLIFCNTIFCQDIGNRLSDAMVKLEKDPQFKHAVLSMYVVDSKTGKVVFAKNPDMGLAPASCQKIITSAGVFELLGKGYRYKTEVGFVFKKYGRAPNFDSVSIKNGTLKIIGYGDPTVGSWRYDKNAAAKFVQRIKAKIIEYKLQPEFTIIDDSKFGTQSIPNGWIWEDIGNYYGAGAGGFNWNENQYKLILQSGKKIGDKVTVLNSSDTVYKNELYTAAAGSGDNAYIYLSENNGKRFLRGTIPLSANPLEIYGAVQSGALLFSDNYSNDASLGLIQSVNDLSENGFSDIVDTKSPVDKLFFTHYSPPLDSINYWFLKKSVNLYGEAFVKTIGYEKKGMGITDTGIAIIKYFWKQRGIDPSAIKIIDGSGLSPANRVTTNALVTILQYAKKQDWFSSFYHSMPEMNGIKMKDGYIGGVRSYTGYIKSKSGTEYSFAFIANNFDGSPTTVREKMWKVLDILK